MLIEGVTLTGREAGVTDGTTFLLNATSPRFSGKSMGAYQRPGWQLHSMPTKHDIMVEAPEALADLLRAISDRQG